VIHQGQAAQNLWPHAFLGRAQSPHHVHVDHRDGFTERKEWMLAVILRAEQADLFTAESDKYETASAAVGLLADSPGHFHKSRSAGTVVIRAMMNRRFLESRQTSHAAVAQMVIVSTENDGFRGQGTRAFEITDDILDVDSGAFHFLLQVSRPSLKGAAARM